MQTAFFWIDKCHSPAKRTGDFVAIADFRVVNLILKKFSSRFQFAKMTNSFAKTESLPTYIPH
jgi:hypothetical protein